jgi:hypothetical protein
MHGRYTVNTFQQKSFGECWQDGKGLATNTIGLIENDVA